MQGPLLPLESGDRRSWRRAAHVIIAFTVGRIESRPRAAVTRLAPVTRVAGSSELLMRKLSINGAGPRGGPNESLHLATFERACLVMSGLLFLAWGCKPDDGMSQQDHDQETKPWSYLVRARHQRET
jgi:hypothetical protein